jgi:aryl-alcohol dehydrogenase-like predicted oxidoreductase
MLQEQVQAGKVRHLGISVRTPRAPGDNSYQTDSATRVGASAIQVVYNRLHRAPEEDVLPSCERQGLGVLARVPLASGFLSGKYGPDARFPENDVRHGRTPEQIRETIEEVQRIQREEVPAGTDMAQWALAWCLKNPAVSCVIPGCKSVAQVEQNAVEAGL